MQLTNYYECGCTAPSQTWTEEGDMIFDSKCCNAQCERKTRPFLTMLENGIVIDHDVCIWEDPKVYGALSTT